MWWRLQGARAAFHDKHHALPPLASVLLGVWWWTQRLRNRDKITLSAAHAYSAASIIIAGFTPGFDFMGQIHSDALVSFRVFVRCWLDNHRHERSDFGELSTPSTRWRRRAGGVVIEEETFSFQKNVLSAACYIDLSRRQNEGKASSRGRNFQMSRVVFFAGVSFGTSCGRNKIVGKVAQRLFTRLRALPSASISSRRSIRQGAPAPRTGWMSATVILASRHFGLFL